MKTLSQIYRSFKPSTHGSPDHLRIMAFVPEEDLPKIGVHLEERHKCIHSHVTLTRENVLKRIEKDVQYGFEVASSLDKDERLKKCGKLSGCGIGYLKKD